MGLNDTVRVDKTGPVEEMIERSAVICLYGISGIGKKTLVRMMLEKHSEVYPLICSIEDLSPVPREERQGKACTWYLVRPLEERPYPGLNEKFWDFLRKVPREDKVILATGGKLPEELLEFFWNGVMDIVYPSTFWFTRTETYRYIKAQKSRLDCEQAYRFTGGWAGCLALMVRILRQYPDRWSTKELWSRYEIRQYIRKQILDRLPEDEKKLLQERAAFPRLERELVSLLWEDAQEELEENLFVRGIMVFVPEQKYWYIQPIIRLEIPAVIDEKRCQKAIWWYEKKGYAAEAIECCLRMKDQARLRECLIRNFTKVPFLPYLPKLDVGRPDTPELFYIRWMEVFFRQDTAEMRKWYKRAEACLKWAERTGRQWEMWKEVFFNIAYTNPEISMDEWMGLLEKLIDPGKPIRLYDMPGEAVSWLSGLRDLSELFSKSKEQESHYRKVWFACLSEENRLGYEIARTEYLYQTDQIAREPERALNLLPLQSSWKIRVGILFLMYLFVEGSREKGIISEKMGPLLESLKHEEDEICRYNSMSLYYLAEARAGEKEHLVRWFRDTGGEIVNKAGKTKLHLMAAVKVHLFLGNYDAARKTLDLFLPYVEKNKIWKYWAEALFQRALVEKELGSDAAAMRYLAESFRIAEPFRYVYIYIGYGKKGEKLLCEYREWVEAGTVTVQKRKKKYYYRNVKTMPLLDWLDFIIRKAGKNQGKYLEERTGGKGQEVLTETEKLIFQYLDRGYSNSEIAEKMNVKITTVKSHIYNIYKKLGVSTRAQALSIGKEQKIY